MATFDQYIKKILGENIPPVPAATQQNTPNQAPPDLSKLDKDQLAELIKAATTPGVVVSKTHPVAQYGQSLAQNKPQTIPGQKPSVQQTPVAQTPTTQSNAANQQAIKTA